MSAEQPARPVAPGNTARARTLWKLDRQRNRRRISLALDAHINRMYRLGEPEPYDGDYDGDYWRDSGMTLGVAERERDASR